MSIWGDPVGLHDQVRIVRVHSHIDRARDLEGSLSEVIGLTEDTITLRSLLDGVWDQGFIFNAGEVELERV